MLFVYAIVPLLLMLVLLLVCSMPAKRVMPIVWLATALLAIVVWRVPLNWIASSTVHGALQAMSIMLIIFGSVLLVNNLQTGGAITTIQREFAQISSDKRVQILIIAYIFVNLLEGSAGFGAPAAIVAPLLVSMGIPAHVAVAVALIGDSTSVTFGAVGTPIVGGLLPTIDGANVRMLLSTAGTDWQQFSTSVGIWAAIPHLLFGLLIPLIQIVVYTLYTDRATTMIQKLKSIIDIVPFALLCGASFVVPFVLCAIFIGPELPSLIGAIVSLIVVLVCTRFGVLLPRKKTDSNPASQNGTTPTEIVPSVAPWRAWAPYVLVVLLLLLTRLEFFGIRQLVTMPAVTIRWTEIFNTSVSWRLQPLYSPGVIPFILVSIIAVVLFRIPYSTASNNITRSLKQIAPAMVALIFAIGMVNVLRYSHANTNMYPSMLNALADGIAAVGTNIWIVCAPLVGVIGAFMTGSATVSNVLFSALHYNIALNSVFPIVVILGLQATGGAAGNMICIHNIVAASATVGLQDMEGRLVRINIVIVALYALCAALTSWIALQFIPTLL